MSNAEWLAGAYEVHARLSNQAELVPAAIEKALKDQQEAVGEQLKCCLEVGPGEKMSLACRIAYFFTDLYLGVERNLKAAFSANELPSNIKVVNADFRDWFTKNLRGFDAVISSHSIYYFRKDEGGEEGFIRSLLECTAPDGRVYLVVNGHDEDSDYGHFKQWFFGGPRPGHVASVVRVEEAIERIGCKSDRIDIPVELEFDDPTELRKALRLLFEPHIADFDAREVEVERYITTNLTSGRFETPQSLFVLSAA